MGGPGGWPLAFPGYGTGAPCRSWHGVTSGLARARGTHPRQFFLSRRAQFSGPGVKSCRAAAADRFASHPGCQPQDTTVVRARGGAGGQNGRPGCVRQMAFPLRGRFRAPMGGAGVRSRSTFRASVAIGASISSRPGCSRGCAERWPWTGAWSVSVAGGVEISAVAKPCVVGRRQQGWPPRSVVVFEVGASLRSGGFRNGVAWRAPESQGLAGWGVGGSYIDRVLAPRCSLSASCFLGRWNMARRPPNAWLLEVGRCGTGPPGGHRGP